MYRGGFLLFNHERRPQMSEKRRDAKGRILHNGEIQLSDGRYRFKYVDHNGQEHCAYAKGNAPCVPSYLLLQYGEVRDESEDASVPYGACGYQRNA